MFTPPLGSLPTKAVALTLCLSLAPAPAGGQVARETKQTPAPKRGAADGERARAALAEGRDLLRRRKPEQALARLNSALKLFARAGDAVSEGVVRDLMGDAYWNAGQYESAATEYEEAAARFEAAGDGPNARLVLAKIGEVYAASGATADAKAAFAEGGDVPPGVRGQAETADSGTAAAGADRPESNAPSPEEARAFDLVNAERKAQGLPPLVWEPRLTLLARRHSTNMARAGFFSHTDQDGLGLAQRARTSGLSYEEIGENLGNSQGYEDPVAFAVERWINHEGHRENILSSRFTHAGIGTSKAKDGTVLFTQVFASFRDATLGAAAAPAGGGGYKDFFAYVTSEFGLGRLAFEAGRAQEARAHFTNILTASAAERPFGRLAQPKRFRVVALTSLGDLALAEGNLAAALGFYTRAVEGATKDARPELAWAAHRGAARTSWLMAGREADAVEALRLRNEALAAYRKAAGAVERISLGSPRSEEARRSFLAKVEEVYTEAAGVFAEMALMSAPRQSQTLEGAALTYAEAGLGYSDQGRARALLGVLGDARAELSQGVPPEALRRRAEILARLDEIARATTGVSPGADLAPAAVEALEAEAEELERRQAESEEKVRGLNPRYAALTKPQPLALPELRRQVLGEGAALLEYGLGAESSYLWVVTADSLALHRLPARATLEAKVAEFRSKLVPRSPGRPAAGAPAAEAARGLSLTAGAATAPVDVKDYAAAARDLYQAVLAPAAAAVAGKRLLVVADGALRFIPFEALVTGDGGESYASLPYLLRSNEVAYAPSASVVAALRVGAAPAAADARLLVVADPVFEDTDPRAAQAPRRAAPASPRTRSLTLRSALDNLLKSAGGGAARLERLTGTREEAQGIAKLTSASRRPATVMLDFEASETSLLGQDLKAYDILHVATHGLLNAERPQFSGLALSLVGDEENDGFLGVEEIFNLRLGARLVVLSACETGLGELKRGEGVSGFTQGFMYAGARDLVVTLWPISDAATARLMPGFYRRLLADGARTSAPAALRAAQLEMVDGGRFSAPFYWAPFVLIGNAD
jgi:CHAT domain-containing protein/uncharacterized protein YkwD